MKKFILSVVVLLGTTSFSQEVSVFGAGNIASSNPYGLTENEQILLENKKRVDSVVSKMNTQSEEMIGLRSVVEGSNSQIAKLESRVSDLEIRTTGRVSDLASSNKFYATKKDLDEIKSEISELKKQIEILNQRLGVQGSVKKKNLDQNELQSELQSGLKSELKNDLKSEALVAQNLVANKNSENLVENVSQNSKISDTKKSNKILAFDDMDPKEIEKTAKELFDDKKFIESKVYFDYLNSKNYNPAFVNYMLGEIHFNQKSYENAIKNYQTSLRENDNTSYIPNLLYHSGISLEKIGDKSNADKFFSVLKSQFPNSTQAKLLQ